MCSTFPRWAATVLGLAAILLAVGATALGLDHNPDWGPSRQAVLLLGISAVVLAHRSRLGKAAAAAWLGVRSTDQGQRFADIVSGISRPVRTMQPGLQQTALSAGRILGFKNPPGLDPDGDASGATPRPVSGLGKSRGRWVLALVLAIELVYLWFVSVGFWLEWPAGTDYYDELAESFQRGQTYFQVEPDPRLLQLEDPYSFPSREGIPVLWDASYYRGKYYAYWGPAPAALLVIPKSVLALTITDPHVVFLATSAVLIFSTLILASIWSRYFAGNLPFWLLLTGVLFAGLGLPSLWVLSYPTIHEAAVSSGMAFFLGGLFAALPVLVSGRISRVRRGIAGTLWALAVASRAVLLVPTVVVSAAVLLMLVKERKEGRRDFALDGLCLLLPLVLAAMALGWYNNNRFGDPLETGFRYQLSWRDATLDRVFDPRYIFPNLYNYVFGRARTLAVFPFIKPTDGAEAVPFLPGNLHPSAYTSENMSGLIPSAPGHLFAAFLAWWVVCGQTRPALATKAPALERGRPAHRLRLSMGVLFVVALSAFMPVGIYYWAANRFQMDFLPMVALLSVVGSWVAIDGLRARPIARLAVLTALVALFLVSAVVPFLLAVSGDQLRFERLNPALFDWITRALAL